MLPVVVKAYRQPRTQRERIAKCESDSLVFRGGKCLGPLGISFPSVYAETADNWADIVDPWPDDYGENRLRALGLDPGRRPGRFWVPVEYAEQISYFKPFLRSADSLADGGTAAQENRSGLGDAQADVRASCLPSLIVGAKSPSEGRRELPELISPPGHRTGDPERVSCGRRHDSGGVLATVVPERFSSVLRVVMGSGVRVGTGVPGRRPAKPGGPADRILVRKGITGIVGERSMRGPPKWPSGWPR